MEDVPHVPTNPNFEREIRDTIRDIKDVYQQAVDEMLDDDDPLKQKIIDYFVNRVEVDDEYSYLLSKLSEADRHAYASNLRQSLRDSDVFLSQMERYFATQTIYDTQEELQYHPRLASQEEYDMGVYLELLEPQVKDAMLLLHKKGYKTFQSGHKEREPYNQFVDVYNADVSIPDEVRNRLKQYGVEINVEHFEDRTTITLRPGSNKKYIPQATWKEIWDYVANNLPKAGDELVQQMGEPTMQRDFRRQQDVMRQENRNGV